MLRGPVFREDSDADDEYERDGLMSPTLPTEFSGSPTGSDNLSTEQTPTFPHHLRGSSSPGEKVMDWTADQSADFVAELGLEQYADKFVGMQHKATIKSRSNSLQRNTLREMRSLRWFIQT